jgi:hypothetical protein
MVYDTTGAEERGYEWTDKASDISFAERTELRE